MAKKLNVKKSADKEMHTPTLAVPPGHNGIKASKHNDIIIDIFEMRNPVIDTSSLFRKDVFCDIGGYEPKWYLIPDLHLWVKAMLAGCRFVNIPEQLVLYRKYSNSVTGQNTMQAIKQHKALYRAVVTQQKKEVFFI